MTQPLDSGRLLELLHQAFDEQVIPDDSHFVDDQELMVRWSCNRLSPEETEDILQHLSLCPECRDVLATLIECEVWDLPALSLDNAPDSEPQEAAPTGTGALDAASSDDSPTPDSTVAEQPVMRPRPVDGFSAAEVSVPSRRRLPRAWMWVGVAAVAVIVVMAALMFPPPESGPQLALLEQQFALNRLDRDLEYSLTGNSLSKTLVLNAQEPSAREQELLEAYREEVAKYPAHVQLREKYGQLLLQLRQWEQARSQFLEVLSLDPESDAASQGLGIVAFEQGEYAQAQHYFEQALKRRPENEDIKVNLAITLEKRGNREKSLPLWRELRRTTGDPQLKSDIDREIR